MILFKNKLFPLTNSTTKIKKLISAEISKFREQGIVQSALASFDQIVSYIFHRLKKSGKVRIIINLVDVNTGLLKLKFKQ